MISLDEKRRPSEKGKERKGKKKMTGDGETTM